MLVFQFGVAVVPVEYLLYAMLSATAFYGIYYVTYKTRLRQPRSQPRTPIFTMNRVETNLTWVLLALVAVGTVGIFFMQTVSCCLSWIPTAKYSPVMSLVSP